MIFQHIFPSRTTQVFDIYWKFAAERQSIFFKRLIGAHSPWTSDEILQKYKFTNVYRASDRVSQYLIRHVIYKGSQSPAEVIFRIMIFKIFNKIETWELLCKELGSVCYADYSFKRYDSILGKAVKDGKSIYSAAYIMPSGKNEFCHIRKYQNHLKLLELMFKKEVPKIIPKLNSLKELFNLLKSFPTIGDFLAYQYAIDINYSDLTNFSEMEFVVPGPGARQGIRKCFPGLEKKYEVEAIKLMVGRQEQEFERLGLNFKTLWERPLQLIDCQNIFCEIDKYTRLKCPNIKTPHGRTRIKQLFRMNHEKIDFWFPPKWGLNKLIPNMIKLT